MRGCDQLRTKYNKLKDSHKELEKDNHQLVIDLESVNADVSRLTHNVSIIIMYSIIHKSHNITL